MKDTSYSIDNICGIACQETAYFWLRFIDVLSPADVCARCVLDGSGDYKPEENPRSVFPRNTGEFRTRYGDDFTNLLIEEGNKARKLREMGPVNWIYKGYGIFQYDLQFVEADPDFFSQKLWYDFGVCLDRLMRELRRTWAQHGDLLEAIRAYNGSGHRASVYAQNVIAYSGFAGEITGVMPA